LTLRQESFEENVKIAIFDGRALALDETAEVKEEDVRNKSTKLIWQFQFNICTFHFWDNYCKNDE
jgi:hypothetical protein